MKEKHYLLGGYILGIKNNYTHRFIPSEKSEMLEQNARIFLVITKLRKERIQNISNYDLKAEGFENKTDFIK